MAFTIIESGTYVADNRTGAAPLEWSELIARNLVVEEGSWFSTGQLQLQLQVFFSVTIDPLGQKRNTERFVNPTQLQIGHYALMSDGFVLQDDRLKYEKQAISLVSPIVEISNTRSDVRQQFGLTANSRAGHAQQISEISVCGTVRGLQVPPPGPVAWDNSQTIPKGSVCLKTALGQTEFQEIEPFLPGEKRLIIDTKSLLLPDEVRGILWTGYRLEVGWLLGYNQEASTGITTPPVPFVQGDVQPALFSYSCISGVPVATAGTCDPSTAVELQYDPARGYFYLDCIPNIVP
jgi:hypothetical protein